MVRVQRGLLQCQSFFILQRPRYFRTSGTAINGMSSMYEHLSLPDRSDRPQERRRGRERKRGQQEITRCFNLSTRSFMSLNYSSNEFLAAVIRRLTTLKQNLITNL